jgi:hypothetical protein
MHGIRLIFDQIGITSRGEHEFIHAFGQAVGKHFAYSQKDSSFSPRMMSETVYGQPFISGGGAFMIIHTGLPARVLKGAERTDLRFQWSDFTLR